MHRNRPIARMVRRGSKSGIDGARQQKIHPVSPGCSTPSRPNWRLRPSRWPSWSRRLSEIDGSRTSGKFRPAATQSSKQSPNCVARDDGAAGNRTVQTLEIATCRRNFPDRIGHGAKPACGVGRSAHGVEEHDLPAGRHGSASLAIAHRVESQQVARRAARGVQDSPPSLQRSSPQAGGGSSMNPCAGLPSSSAKAKPTFEAASSWRIHEPTSSPPVSSTRVAGGQQRGQRGVRAQVGLARQRRQFAHRTGAVDEHLLDRARMDARLEKQRAGRGETLQVTRRG